MYKFMHPKTLQALRDPLIIVGIVIAANLLLLTGIFTGNPAKYYSGIENNVKTGLLSGQPTIDPNNGYTSQTLGHAAAEQLLHGHMPWWNYNEQVGAPMAGEMQSAALFVPFNLLLIFSNGLLLFHVALEVVAGLATYYLLKRLGCSALASTIGGALFALNGTFAWFGSANMNPVAFLPMLILGIEIALDKTRKARKGGWTVIALALAWSLYAGFPEAAYLDGVLAGVWFLTRAIQYRDGEWLRFVKKVFAGFLLGLLLAAPVLVAFADYLPYANVGGHNGALSHYSLPASTLPAQFMPYIYGPIFHFSFFDHSSTLAQFWDNIGGYLTVSLVFLAVYGVFVRKRKLRPLVFVLAAWSLVILARNYGFPGVTSLINLVPAMHLVAFYRYVNPTLELAVVLLAMIGLDSLLESGKRDRPKIMMVAGAMLLLILCLLPVAIRVDHRLYLAPHHRLWLAVSAAWSVATVLAIAVSAIYLKKYRRVLLPAILLVDALAMFIIPQLSAPRSSTLDTQPISFLQKNLSDARFYSIGSLNANYSSYYSIAAINTNNMPVAKNWTTYITKQLNPNANPLDGFTGIDEISPAGPTPLQAFLARMPAYEAIDVKYVIINNILASSANLEQHSLKQVFNDGYYRIYQLPAPKPFFQVAGGRCGLTSSSPATLGAVCVSPASIVRRELYMPGWTAGVNGTRTAVSRSGALSQTFRLPRGTSKVTFTYTPPHIVLAYLAFVVGTATLLLPAARKLVAKNPQRK